MLVVLESYWSFRQVLLIKRVSMYTLCVGCVGLKVRQAEIEKCRAVMDRGIDDSMTSHS